MPPAPAVIRRQRRKKLQVRIAHLSQSNHRPMRNIDSNMLLSNPVNFRVGYAAIGNRTTNNRNANQQFLGYILKLINTHTHTPHTPSTMKYLKKSADNITTLPYSQFLSLNPFGSFCLLYFQDLERCDADYLGPQTIHRGHMSSPTGHWSVCQVYRCVPSVESDHGELMGECLFISFMFNSVKGIPKGL